MMRFSTLQEWLNWQESLHPRKIDLGLERVARVQQDMGLVHPPFCIITIAGTNGKGSCTVMLEGILNAAGYRVASYSSPHLLRYNERIRVLGEEVTDIMLCEAFARVDAARKGVTLTYFEFGTLAAIDIFFRAGLEVVILEVGLGGRLDAVNILDADVALVSTIAIDHEDWLGKGRESIAREKVGIFRAGLPAVCGDPDVPKSMVDYAAQLSTPLFCINSEFGYSRQLGTWSWWGPGRRYRALDYPALQGLCQLQNAASVLMVLELLGTRFPIQRRDIAKGLAAAYLPGRFQVLPGPVMRILDVAHNPSSALVLAETLTMQSCHGKTRAIVAMLADKDIPATLAALKDIVDCWYVTGLLVERGARSQDLLAALHSIGVRGNVRECAGSSGCTGSSGCADVAAVYRQVMQEAEEGDRVVIFGSFHTVAEILRYGQSSA